MAIFGPFWPYFMQNLRNNVKNQKSAWNIFLVLLDPYFMQNFRKIVGAVSEKLPEQTHGRTDGRTDGGYFIGPFGFQPGTKNWTNMTNIEGEERTFLRKWVFYFFAKFLKKMGFFARKSADFSRIFPKIFKKIKSP